MHNRFILVDPEEPMPPPPRLGVKPPSDMAERERRKFVYGFPLTEEWFQYRYHWDVELGPKFEDIPLESDGKRCFTAVVETGTHGWGSFLVVGGPGQKPAPEKLEKIVDLLWEYAIIERPGWYPQV